MTQAHFPQTKVHLVDAIRIARDIVKIKKQRARYKAFCCNNPEKKQKKNSEYYKKHREIILKRRRRLYSWKKFILMANAVSGPVVVI